MVRGVIKMSSDKQRIIDEFLSYPDNQKLYDDYLDSQSDDLKEKLDKEFKKFYQNIRILSYVIKMLHYESKRLDKKERDYRRKNDLTFDLYSENFQIPYADLINETDDISEVITSEKLFLCIQNLSQRQKDILSLVYIKQFTDKEIAKELQISQQAVSKSRKKILEIIRKELLYDWC